MKPIPKYLIPPFITLFMFLLGGAFILIIDLIVPIAYDYLSYNFPETFGKPSPISDKEAYDALHATLTVITVAINIFIITKISMRLDNKRFEELTARTEGLFRIPETSVWYARTYWVSDVITSSFAPLLLILPAYLVPSEYIAPYYPILWCGGRMLPYFDLTQCILIILPMSIAMRFLMIPGTLTAWRASWLTGSID